MCFFPFCHKQIEAEHHVSSFNYIALWGFHLEKKNIGKCDMKHQQVGNVRADVPNMLRFLCNIRDCFFIKQEKHGEP